MNKFSQILKLMIGHFHGAAFEMKVASGQKEPHVYFEFDNGVTLNRFSTGIVSLTLSRDGKQIATVSWYSNDQRETKTTSEITLTEIEQVIVVELEALFHAVAVLSGEKQVSDTLPAGAPEPSNVLNEAPQPVVSDYPSDIPPVLRG